MFNSSVISLGNMSLTNKVFLGGLPGDILADEVKEAFKEYGKIENVEILYDKETKKCRGFGFITFDSPEPAEKVLALQHFSIAGKLVEVKSANPKVDRNKMNNSGHNHGPPHMGGGSGMGPGGHPPAMPPGYPYPYPYPYPPGGPQQQRPSGGGGGGGESNFLVHPHRCHNWELISIIFIYHMHQF